MALSLAWIGLLRLDFSILGNNQIDLAECVYQTPVACSSRDHAHTLS